MAGVEVSPRSVAAGCSLVFFAVVGAGSSFGGNASRIPPMPTPVLRMAVTPMMSCFRVKCASHPALGNEVGASGGSAEMGGTATGTLSSGTLAALDASDFDDAGTEDGEGTVTDSGADRGNIGLPGISTAIGSVIRDPFHQSGILLATRNFALRARGLRAVSASPASTGFLLTGCQTDGVRNACFTRRSSSE